MKAYYDRRAPEYDDWWLGTGLHAARHRPGWDEAVSALTSTLEALRPARTLDVACGTGFLTRHLPGEIVGLDQSESMLTFARKQAAAASFVRGEALSLPFPDDAFERLFTSFFYGHLEETARETFLGEAHRVAAELVVVDAALHAEAEPLEWQQRVLKDGSRWEVYKRFFSARGLAHELGGGRTLLDNRWFVAVEA